MLTGSDAKIRLGTKLARELPGPADGEAERVHWDAELPGFGLRIYASGRRTWIVRYRPKGSTRQRYETLGTLEQLPGAEARNRAREVLAKARLGHDLRAERRHRRLEEGSRFGRLAEAFLAAKANELRPATLADYRRYLLRTFADWHDRPITAIGRDTIRKRLAELVERGGAVAANRARTALSSHFAWTIARGAAPLEANPVAAVPPPTRESSRSRVLSLEELARVWNAADPAEDFGAIVRLLILTGARRAEVGGMRWPELDLEQGTWRLPGERAKNRRPHSVPLAEPAVALLAARPRWLARDLVFGQGPNGFRGWSAGKARLDARLAAGGRPLAPWCLHDLRRSVVTHLAELGLAEPHVIEAIVNHVSGHRRGVAGVYNHAVYLAERRRALAAWAERIVAEAPRLG